MRSNYDIKSNKQSIQLDEADTGWSNHNDQKGLEPCLPHRAAIIGTMTAHGYESFHNVA